MKRFCSLLLALCLCLSLCACNQAPEEPPAEDPPAQQDPTPAPDPTPDPEPTPTPDPEPAPTPDPEPAPQPDPEPAAPGVEVDGTHYSHQVIVGEDGATAIKADFTLPDPENMPQITAYYEMVKSDLFAIYSGETGDVLLQKQDLGEAFTPWAMEMDFEVLRNDGTVLSILRELYENRNAAHPSIVYFAETFAVESQGRLLLSNLFTVSEDEYLPRLRDMIVAQMDERTANEGMPYFDYARDQLLSLLDPMDFALTEDSLLIFFDVYSLAPYVAGPQNFELPLSELSDILDTRWVKE